MCGISGILSLNSQPVSPHRLNYLSSSLAHRGTDSFATIFGASHPRLIDPIIGLSHRRLSIVDRTPSSDQPLFSSDNRYSIVFNGELYNFLELRTLLESKGYTFQTESDTEVVLVSFQHWGLTALQFFNGMFAFAIWDSHQKILSCARDQFGIKPFFYSHTSSSFEFSSESRALGSSGLSIEALSLFFLCMHVPGTQSIFSGVQSLSPGHSLQISHSGKLTISQWWSPPPTGINKTSFDDSLEHLDHLLSQAIKRQTTCDVPLGALLSGGFDSGLIVSSTSEYRTLSTYTASFSGNNEPGSESIIADAMSARYSTIHHSYNINSADSIICLDKALSSLSEPIADSSLVPTWYLVQSASSHGIKVLLSGSGGDEVFAGYTRYTSSSLVRSVINLLPPLLRSTLSSLLPRSILSSRLSSIPLDMCLYTSGSLRLAHSISSLSSPLNFLTDCVIPSFNAPFTPCDSLYRKMAYDLTNYLPQQLLFLFDQLTMAHTIEGRVPLLDIHLVNFLFSLPSSYHYSFASPKGRRLCRRFSFGKLDPRTFQLQKQGFSGPYVKWIQNHENHFKDHLFALRPLGYFDNFNLDNWWCTPSRRSPQWYHETFILYCFSVWHSSNVR